MIVEKKIGVVEGPSSVLQRLEGAPDFDPFAGTVVLVKDERREAMDFMKNNGVVFGQRKVEIPLPGVINYEALGIKSQEQASQVKFCIDLMRDYLVNGQLVTKDFQDVESKRVWEQEMSSKHGEVFWDIYKGYNLYEPNWAIAVSLSLQLIAAIAAKNKKEGMYWRIIRDAREINSRLNGSETKSSPPGVAFIHKTGKRKEEVIGFIENLTVKNIKLLEAPKKRKLFK